MYNVKGVINVSNVSGPTAFILFLLNMGLGALGIMIVGLLLHIGWNWI
ncbi:membrane protein [Streptomyces phage Enygma]